ncbi:ABC transporter ATP-binding protein [Paenibacillus albiflavus]|uniref:Carnitine transport ATP-binding protein OpuCA n=1 Tax=Paenibacillus albiflavus TaxID=2545760 RepID=A0A4R4E2E2_9BACL|nr:ABC transporter ATP-binding protein [Paenibacillus albiflavus]TCZ73569.1 ABC transporter ATP-binding protein [Paenibacillus albiflavus]
MLNSDAIVFDKVMKQFPRAANPSVQETTLHIPEGSFITILGASGCGKTTLLKMVNRLYEPTSGRILVHGQDINRISVNELRRDIGYVIQQIGLFPHMTIEENIATVPRILGWNKQKIADRVNELLELVHLNPSDYRKRYPRQLSGGQQQRVGLARAMAGNPSILLMDEPFGSIDAITRSSLQEELTGIQKMLRTTILFVTHDIEEALKLGDRIVIMKDGVIQQYDTPLQIMTRPANRFVSQLVQSEDVVQQLSLMSADKVMIPIEEPSHPDESMVQSSDSLRLVLNEILNSSYPSVVVTDSSDHPIGRITFEQLKAYIAISKVMPAT